MIAVRDGISGAWRYRIKEVGGSGVGGKGRQRYSFTVLPFGSLAADEFNAPQSGISPPTFS
ncbi:MAG: hypothetical protein WBK88_03400 [Methanothrix sp.]